MCRVICDGSVTLDECAASLHLLESAGGGAMRLIRDPAAGRKSVTMACLLRLTRPGERSQDNVPVLFEAFHLA